MDSWRNHLYKCGISDKISKGTQLHEFMKEINFTNVKFVIRAFIKMVTFKKETLHQLIKEKNTYLGMNANRRYSSHAVVYNTSLTNCNMWNLFLGFSPNEALQISHFEDVVPSWTNEMCSFNSSFSENLLSQMAHLKGFFTSWTVSMCKFSLLWKVFTFINNEWMCKFNSGFSENPLVTKFTSESFFILFMKTLSWF